MLLQLLKRHKLRSINKTGGRCPVMENCFHQYLKEVCWLIKHTTGTCSEKPKEGGKS